MSIKNIPAVLVISLVFFSCQTGNEKMLDIDFNIISPKSDWVYSEDVKVVLAINADTQDIVWKSSLDGELGSGNHLLLFLSPGVHEISADVLGVVRICRINVFKSDEYSKGSKTLLNYSPMEKKLSDRENYSYIITHDGSLTGCGAENTKLLSAQRYFLYNSGSNEYPIRDIRLDSPLISRNMLINGKMNNLRTLTTSEYSNGDKRIFFIMNTASPSSEPHELEAELYYSSDKLAFWIPAFGDVQKTLIDECIQITEEIILPRLKTLWGESADINGDGRVGIVIAPSINEENLALGFFNASDFYKRNNDINSVNYNPASNEMDVIYIASPENITGSAYSVKRITATIAHELTHAINFTNKTWIRNMNGYLDADREELFLDEGMSHLSENLCGYGVSGGNIKFLKYFLENTADFSFCGADRLGREDSAGMRGAVCLFLSWLFWRQGGIEFSETDPNILIDRGGITFLQALINSPYTGWENIGHAANTGTKILFEEMIAQMNILRQTDKYYTYKVDAVTKEPIDFFVNMKTQNSPDIIAGFPKEYNIGTGSSIGPWSFMFFSPFTLNNGNKLIIVSEDQKGTVYFLNSPNIENIKTY
jgi:hypothetical protein